MKFFRKLAAAGMLLALLFLVFSSVRGHQPSENSSSSSSDNDAADDAATKASEEPSAKTDGTARTSQDQPEVVKPLIILGIGIAIVLGLIIVFKVNAFIALISAAMVVSLLSVVLLGQGSVEGAIGRVATSFGGSAGGIGIVIALAAVIGKCMLDSGAADRIVRAFLRLLGEKGAPVALMGSGFVLAVPVFFDTVFYLLVPLARSLYRKTNRNYLLYLMAIGAGGAITHTLVPPTPGPLMMASNLGFDVGWMIMIGTLVALPAAIVGVIWAKMTDSMMNVPMRQVGSEPEPDPLKDEELPSLFMSLLPVLLPVVLIATNTVLTTIADNEHAAQLKVSDITDWPAWHQNLREQAASETSSPGKRIVEFVTPGKGDGDPDQRNELIALIKKSGDLTEPEQQTLIDGLNKFVLGKKKYHREDAEDAFVGVLPNGTARSLLKQSRTRMKQSVVERLNRSLLESAYPENIKEHAWETNARIAANYAALFGNANLVLLLSTVIALWLVARQRGLNKAEVAALVENSLMSGGVIILITAGGGAFGAMLQTAQVGPAIQAMFSGSSSGGETSQLMLLFLAFLLGSLLKIAQGSGTVSMIVGTSMMAAIIGPIDLTFHPVYIACAVGAGSMICSWMNDSGFWIFAKMGGLTEIEALKSWTVMLAVCGVVTFVMTVILSFLLPLV